MIQLDCEMAKYVSIILIIIAASALVNDLFFGNSYFSRPVAPSHTGPMPDAHAPARGAEKRTDRRLEPAAQASNIENYADTLQTAQDQLGIISDLYMKMEASLEAERKKSADRGALRENEQSRAKSIEADLDSMRARLAHATRQAASAARLYWLMRLDADKRSSSLQERVATLSSKLSQSDSQTNLQINACVKVLNVEKDRIVGLKADLESARQRVSDLSTTELANTKQRAAQEADIALLRVRSEMQAAVAGKIGRLSMARGRPILQALELERQEVRRLVMDLAISHEQMAHSPVSHPSKGKEACMSTPRSDGPAAPVDRNIVQSNVSANPDDSLPNNLKAVAQRVPQQHGASSALPQIEPNSNDKKGYPSPRLPDGVSAHIVLHFAQDSESARDRALTLRAMLTAQGIDVAEPIGTSAGGPRNSVTYYYKPDLSVAHILALQLVATEVARGSNPIRSLPRPGTIEISIGG